MTRTGLESIADEQRRALLVKLLQLLEAEFKDDLVSVVVFGSVGRNQATTDSDTDILVVNSAFERSMTDRMARLVNVLQRLEHTKPFREMERRGVNTWIQFHPLNVEEAALNRAIYLDMTQDAVILFDKDNLMRRTLERLGEKLRALGAKRIFLEDGSWYWDLKPDIKRGEVVEL